MVLALMVLLEIIDYHYRPESCDHWRAAHGLAGHTGLTLPQVFKSSAEWRDMDRGTLLLKQGPVGECGFQTLDRWNGLMFDSLNSSLYQLCSEGCFNTTKDGVMCEAAQGPAMFTSCCR